MPRPGVPSGSSAGRHHDDRPGLRNPVQGLPQEPAPSLQYTRQVYYLLPIRLKDLQSSLASLWHRDWYFSDECPNSFPCTVLLNANRAGSMGKRTHLGVHGRSKATVQIFKLWACPLDPLNLLSAIYCSVRKWSRGSAVNG